MLYMSPRELVRRWYGQVEPQARTTTERVKNLVAHTIVPSNDSATFSGGDFAPLSKVIDLFLCSLRDTITDEVQAVNLRGYKMTYDAETNQAQLGGPDNLVLSKDLMMRPFKGATRKIIDPVTEQGLLLSGLEMEAEREAASKWDGFMRFPEFAELSLSFTKDSAPRFDYYDELKRFAWYMVQPDAPPLRSLCAPQGYQGKVKHLMKDIRSGVQIIQLEDHASFDEGSEQLCFEIPTWAKVFVKRGQLVSSKMELASVAMHRHVLEPIRKANETDNQKWDGVEDYLGKPDANRILRLIWESEKTPFAGMTMLASRVLPKELASKACGAWRDLRYSLGRCCHNYMHPSQIIRIGPREGKISVWEVDPSEPVTASLDNCKLDFELPTDWSKVYQKAA